MRRLGATLIVAALVLGGCGSSSNKPHVTSGASSRPAGRPGPHGRLTPAEFRAIVHEYAVLQPLDPTHAGKRALHPAQAGCDAVAKVGTALAARVAQDCRNALHVGDSAGAFASALAKCQSGRSGARVGCAAKAYTRLSHSLELTRATAGKINNELARRGIGGLCARSIGISRKALAALTGAEFAAAQSAVSLQNGDSDGYARASALLQRALAEPPDPRDPLAGIRKSCPHGASAPPAPRQPTPKRHAPRHRQPDKPSPLLPGDRVKT